MKIVCDTTFLHDRDRYEVGDTRTVPDELGAYFVKNGWAHAQGDNPNTVAAPAEVTLDVQNSNLSTEARLG